MLDLAGAGAGERVLDVGCGDGAVAGRLAERGVWVVAVDLSLAMVRSARQRGAVPVVADMRALPFCPSFDGAACIGASEFVSSLEAVAAELAGSLRPGGWLVLLLPRRNWLGWGLWLYHRLHGVRIHLRSRDAVVRATSAAGLEPPSHWRRCAAAWVCRMRLGRRSADT